MNRTFTLLVLLAAVFLTGCLDYESRIQVRPDGSGYLIETMKFDNKMMAFIQQMASDMQDEDNDTDSEENFFDEEELRARSAEYGEGVTYVSGHAIDEGGKEGYTVTYAFTDITKLKVGKKSVTRSMKNDEKNMEESMESTEAHHPGGGADGESPLEKISFSFSRGNPSMLTFSLLSKEDMEEFREEKQSRQAKTEKTESDSLAAEMALTMLRPMMQGMRIRFVIEPLGTITGTNANHRDGSQITLFDMEFDKLLDHAESARTLMSSDEGPETAEELETFLKNTPGIRGQTGEVWVKFE